jgi:ribonuclease E
MVETPPEKVEAMAEEVVIPKRPRRRVKKTAAAPTEPLMQIETRE